MSPWLQDNLHRSSKDTSKQKLYKGAAWSRSIFRFGVYVATALMLILFTINGIKHQANAVLIAFSCLMVGWLGLYAWYASRWLRPRALYRFYYPHIKSQQKWDIDELADKVGRPRYFAIQDLRVLHSNGFLPGADMDPRTLILHSKLPEPD